MAVKLLLEIEDKKATFEWEYNDVGVDELIDAFKGILVAQTYQENSFKNIIMELAEEYEAKDKD